MTTSEIKADINFLCGSTSATYPDADKMRNVNVAYNHVARLIWDSADGWNYQDSNTAGLPVAFTTMTHDTQDYTLPTTAQRIHRVEVKQNNGTWLKLAPIDIHDMLVAAPEFQGNNPGLPLYYDLQGRSVSLYPSPASGSVTLTSGLAFYVDRDVTEIATTATTTTPGFAKPFHRILSLAAAIDFTQDDRQRQLFVTQKLDLERGLVRFYSKRNVERPTTISPHSRRRWRSYL